MSNLLIREPVVEDCEAWSGLWRSYLEFYGTTRSEDVFDWAWDRILSGDSDMFSRLAFIGDKPVGLVNFLYHKSFWEPELRCYLNDLYTVAEARGSGVGQALIAAVTSHAKERNAARLYWLTAQDNKTARALYDKVARCTPFIKYEAEMPL